MEAANWITLVFSTISVVIAILSLFYSIRSKSKSDQIRDETMRHDRLLNASLRITETSNYADLISLMKEFLNESEKGDLSESEIDRIKNHARTQQVLIHSATLQASRDFITDIAETLPAPGSDGASVLAAMNMRTNAKDFAAKMQQGIAELNKLSISRDEGSIRELNHLLD